MQTQSTDVQVVAALLLAVAAAVISTPGYGHAFAKARFLQAEPAIDTTVCNPDGVVLPP